MCLFHFAVGSQVLFAFNHHFVTSIDATDDCKSLALALHFDRFHTHGVFSVDHEHLVATGIGHHGLRGHNQHILEAPRFDLQAHELAWNQRVVGVIHHRFDFHRANRLIHLVVYHIHLAFAFFPISHLKRDGRRLASLLRRKQSRQCTLRHRELHVHRVQLRDGDHRALRGRCRGGSGGGHSVARLHQSTWKHIDDASTTSDRRANVVVAQLCLCSTRCSLSRLRIGTGSVNRALRHKLLTQQLFGSIQLTLGIICCGLRFFVVGAVSTVI